MQEVHEVRRLKKTYFVELKEIEEGIVSKLVKKDFPDVKVLDMEYKGNHLVLSTFESKGTRSLKMKDKEED